MADKEATIVIKKIKKGGHGAHGGAWKVAYADFVTAMMAFFLVMWLMGSDEETRAAVSHYFNNPTSAWRKDLTSPETAPLGDMTGAGKDVVNGIEGQTPAELAEHPIRPMTTHDVEATRPGDILEQFLSNESLMSLDLIRFSVPENQLFKPGTMDEWAPGSEKFLKKLGTLVAKYRGRLQIRGSYSEPKAGAASSPIDGYEFKMGRVVAISHYAVDRNWLREDHIATLVSPSKRSPASEESEAPARIEFTLSRGQ